MRIACFRCISLIFFTAIFSGIYGQQLHLKVAGNERTGFHVDVYHDHQLLATHSEEFTIELFNNDLSAAAKIEWNGATWSGNQKRISLQRNSYIKEFDSNLSVNVVYELVNDNVIRKSVQLSQPSMPGMLYTLQQKIIPHEIPDRYVTFEYDSFPGGMVHEMFPAAGFITRDHLVVGCLTDAGYKNHYTRNTRRRFSGMGGGFVGMRKLPDAELFSVAGASEQKQKNHYISQTFGEMYNLDAGNKTVLTIPDNYITVGKAVAVNENDIIGIHCNPGERAGIEFIAPIRDQKIYTISFFSKGNTPVALKLYRVKNGKKTAELEHGVKYIDNFPSQENEWTLFRGSILVPYIAHDSVAMFIGTTSGNECNLQIKDLEIVEHHPAREPFNVLPIGDTIEKTTYLFVEPWVSHQQFMISAQSRLAEGMGFEGSLIEKMLYANLQMHTWITDIDDFTPFNVPNMNYAPDMYNRDAFFSIISTYDKALNLSVWEQWGKTQTSSGVIGTIITPRMGSVEAKGNEATIEWLIWAMMNKRRFGVYLPNEKIQKAADFVLNEFDDNRDGICTSHFPLNQIDIIDFNPKTDRLSVNQGMLAIALRTIKELGFEISESYLEKAEEAYRNFYDPLRKHLLYDRNYPDIISLTDLEPEFFSLWLFNRPMLSDEIVTNHLNQIPVLNKVSNSPHPELGTTAPILVRLTDDEQGYAYLSSDYQPFGKFGEANYSVDKNDGFYYNGGSWLRPEYCAYVVGLKHGWDKAMPLMENRIWAEIYLHPEWPFSKEFIPTKWTSTDSWWNSTKGLCWNVFILVANEVAGLRLKGK